MPLPRPREQWFKEGRVHFSFRAASIVIRSKPCPALVLGEDPLFDEPAYSIGSGEGFKFSQLVDAPGGAGWKVGALRVGVENGEESVARRLDQNCSEAMQNLEFQSTCVALFPHHGLIDLKQFDGGHGSWERLHVLGGPGECLKGDSILTSSRREGAAPRLPLGKLGGGTSLRGGEVELVGEAEAERVEGVHELPRGGVGLEERGFVVGEAEKMRGGSGLVVPHKAVERDLAVPIEHLLEDIVVEHAGAGVERREELLRQLRVVGTVNTAERVRPRDNGHDLLRLHEAHAGQVLNGELGRVGGEQKEALGVRPELEEAAGERDLGAAADVDGGDGGKVYGVRDGDGGVGVGLEAREELMRHVRKKEALVAFAIELVDDAAVEPEGEVGLVPCAYKIRARQAGEPQPEGRQHAPGGGIRRVVSATLRSDEFSDHVCECLVDRVGVVGDLRRLGRSEDGKNSSSANGAGEHG
ncbi:hypothetical protein BDK51DRAFT_45880 [Blyttiomyces helicus]|uniref:Uncharacterized protein n=1 Tax=Blyttiomyces helicus TaxID=388810 RepID=A0A4P9WM52_9FUNG|nr:hypothetical protein BDK51DRAFT_45880 [Blyttiomyces helicus]|eukprot:RKO93984.1 hypothetical protein BDK51DRAFT_45880 [Blyttiomyces helicus]